MDFNNNGIELFQSIFEQASIGIIQFDLDGQILNANQQCETIFGYSLPDLNGMKINELPISKSEIDQFNLIPHLLRQEDKTVFETQYIHKNGTLITCEITSFLVRNSDKQALYFIFYLRDCTDHESQKESLLSRLHYEKNLVRFSNTLMLKEEHALQNSLQYLLIASQSSRVYIFQNFLDDENQLSIWQTHEVCAEGINPEIDNPLLQHVIYKRDGYERWQKELSKNKIINGIVSDFPDNEREILQSQEIKSILVIPLWLGHEWYGFIGFDDTVTEKIWQKQDIDLLRTASEIIGLDIENEKNKQLLMQSNDDLKLANATKNRFLSLLAHDLKEPFRSVVHLSDLLNQNVEQLDQDQIKEFARHIHSSSNQTYNLLENLLEWPKSQQNKISFTPQSINLHSLVEETYGLISHSAASKSIAVEIDISEQINLRVDEDMFKTVIRNMLSNAIKFTDHNGQVKISALKEDGQLMIRISDSGIGMSEKTKNSLFKIDKIKSIPGTQGEKGTGFGLLLCKEFIDLHKGLIEVESQLGEGSTFIITLFENN